MSASFRRTDLEQHTLRSRLCVLWLLGLLLGCLAAARPSACPTVQWHADGSPWPCIGRLLLELLCAAAASWGLPSGACSTVVFCRAAAFGYTAQGIQVCFGSAGWLLWPLMLWPQLLFFPFLFFHDPDPSSARVSRAFLTLFRRLFLRPALVFAARFSTLCLSFHRQAEAGGNGKRRSGVPLLL